MSCVSTYQNSKAFSVNIVTIKCFSESNTILVCAITLLPKATPLKSINLYVIHHSYTAVKHATGWQSFQGYISHASPAVPLFHHPLTNFQYHRFYLGSKYLYHYTFLILHKFSYTYPLGTLWFRGLNRPS